MCLVLLSNCLAFYKKKNPKGIVSSQFNCVRYFLFHFFSQPHIEVSEPQNFPYPNPAKQTIGFPSQSQALTKPSTH